MDDSKSEELQSLFKFLETEGKIDIQQINKITKKLDVLQQTGKPQNEEDSEKDYGRLLFDPELPEQYMLRSFPNNKTNINFEDFCELYDKSFKSLDNDEDMFDSIFAMFDVEGYYSFPTNHFKVKARSKWTM